MLDQRAQNHLHMIIKQIKANSKLKSAEIRAILFKNNEPIDESNSNIIRLKSNPWRTCGIVIRLMNERISGEKINTLDVESEIEDIKFLQGKFTIDYIVNLIENLKNKDIAVGKYQIFGEANWIGYELKTSQDSNAMNEFESPYHLLNCFLECRENERESIGDPLKYQIIKSLNERFPILALPYPTLSSMMYYKLGLIAKPDRPSAFGIEDIRSIILKIMIPTYLPRIDNYEFYSRLLWIKIKPFDNNDDLMKFTLSISLIASNHSNYLTTITPKEENSINIPYWPESMNIVLGYNGEKIDERQYFLHNDNKIRVYIYDEDWKRIQNELQELRDKFQNIKSEKVDVFLSHSSKDLSLMTTINEALQRLGLSTFLSEETKREGSYIEKIENHIHGCKVFLAILTENGCASQFVQQEIGYAYSLKKRIVTIIGPNKKQKGFITIHDPIELVDNFDITICKLIQFFKNNFSTLLTLDKLHVPCSKCGEMNILIIPNDEEISECLVGKKAIIRICSKCLSQIKLNPYTFSNFIEK